MSENGPREGTRDLPHRDPDAGRRGVDDDSLTARAFDSQSRERRRRAAEVKELADARLSPEAIAVRYSRDHPQEHPMTIEEVRGILNPEESSRPESSQGRR